MWQTLTEGGSVTVADKESFPISADMCGGLVLLRPGGMRQLHWHTNEDEWQYVINGTIQACSRPSCMLCGSNTCI